MSTTIFIKTILIGTLSFFLVLSSLSCERKSEICECFEIRLELKNLISSSKNNSDLTETEEYKLLKERKTECLLTIEPRYFEENGLVRKGRSDKEFLLEEIGDCDAVRELLGADK